MTIFCVNGAPVIDSLSHAVAYLILEC
jgi:hypothetical protein